MSSSLRDMDEGRVPHARLVIRQHPAYVLVLCLFLSTLIAFGALFGLPYRFEIQPGDIHHNVGYAYRVDVRDLWPLTIRADSGEEPEGSRTRAYEDGFQLGPRHSHPDFVRATGRGALSHRGSELLLSTSDNTDPRFNGRVYQGRHMVRLSWWLAAPLLVASLVPVLRVSVPVVLRAARRVRSPRQSLSRWWKPRVWASAAKGPLLRLLGALALTVFVALGLQFISGVLFWVVAGLVLASSWVTMLAAAELAAVSWGKVATRRHLGNGLLVILSCSLTLGAAEASLAIYERVALAEVESAAPAENAEADAADVPSNDTPETLPEISLPPWVLERARARAKAVTMPDEWKRRNVKVPGAREAHYWQGALHVRDVYHMRQQASFPAKRGTHLRVMVLGDSLTYGYGVDNEWTYTSQLQRAFEPHYNIEFLNLGVSGHSSEDILGELRRFLPRLQPDFVLYGVCLNDFLPSKFEQYERNAFALPIPDAWKEAIEERSRVVRLVADGYGALLRTVGLRADFLDDVLRDARGSRVRFAHDVAQMNALVLENGLPPIVTMVLNQYPVVGGRGQRIASVAEQALLDARMNLIPSEPLYQRYDGRRLNVSRWESHPNEEAHAIFAALFKQRLEAWPGLAAYRKNVPDSNTAATAEDAS